MGGNVKIVSLKQCMGGQYIKMILVMLGTQNNSFNRLLEQIDNLIQERKYKKK